jgi:hypothetical protein
MPIPTRACLSIVAVGSVAITFLGPRGTDTAPPPLPADVAAPRPRAAALRSIAKKRIADDVAAGRRTLVEAAALFGALNRLPPTALDPSIGDAQYSQMPAPARTDEERLCRQVITWVENILLREAPDRAEPVVTRLREEYAAALCGGPIRLPAPATLEAVGDLLARAAREAAAAQPNKFIELLTPAPSR